jgi:hypothetical protein
MRCGLAKWLWSYELTIPKVANIPKKTLKESPEIKTDR